MKNRRRRSGPTFWDQHHAVLRGVGVRNRKKPDDPKVLTEFLISKGVFTAKMASDDLGCAVSLVEFANNLRKNVPKAKGFVPAALVVS